MTHLLKKNIIIAAAALTMATAALSSCHHVDNHRLPSPYANLMFWTEADWVTYGVTGAGEHRIFNKSKRIPANFNYLASSLTGFGGIMLCSTFIGEPVAYDMACPVECNKNYTIFINDDMLAECNHCHSLYDVFSLYGAPVGGQAAEHGYGLQLYHVTPGRNGEFKIIY